MSSPEETQLSLVYQHVRGDPLRRAWIELSGANPDEVDRHKPTLVAFLAFDRGQTAKLWGTGFVVAGDRTIAIVATAKHVLTEGVSRFQDLAPATASSALFVPERPQLSLRPQHLKAVWMGESHAGLLDVLCAGYNGSTDLAICAIAPQEHEPPPFEPRTVPFHTHVPRIGDQVHMVSIDSMSVTESEPPSDRSGQGLVIQIERRVSIRLGVVTAVFPGGFRQFRWPCFTTSIPAEPGMSGGYVYIPEHGTTVAACGVVCADTSSKESRVDQMIAGESIIGCTWPAFALPLPERIGRSETRTLLEMTRAGDFPMPLGGVEHIAVATDEQGRQTLRFN